MFWDDIINVNDPRWLETLGRFPRHDFYHLPAYVGLEAERRGGIAHAYVCCDDHAAFLVPFVESPSPLMLQPADTSTSDVTPPYGYASPLVSVEGTEDQARQFVSCALARLIEHLRLRNVCAIMLRFHPLLSVPLEPFNALGRLVFHGETVWTDLSQTPEQMWSDTRHGFRNPINRLERQGFIFELDYTAQYLNDFIKIYNETMLRVHADPQYFFPERYFRDTKSALGPGFVLAHVRNPAGEVVSSGIFTVFSGIVQYHLSGSCSGANGYDASKLLLHGVRKWAREHGLEKLHLGGGVGAKNDSLFQFKSGFSSSRAPFYTWRYIVDEEKYAELNARWERVNRTLADPIDGYFPAYRKILPPPDNSNVRVCA